MEQIMEILIDFPGGARVDAHIGNFTVKTDQPPDASAPTPFVLFLSSLGTCAGIYVLEFCQRRGLPSEGIRLVQHVNRNPATGMVEDMDITIQVPPTFPEKYLPALINSAELCLVKKHLEKPPKIEVKTQVVDR